MALYKSFTDARGMTTSYHKVSHIALTTNVSAADKDELTMTVGVSAYADQSYRENDLRNYLSVDHYNFGVSMEEANAESIFTIAYKKLKTLNKFQDALDV